MSILEFTLAVIVQLDILLYLWLIAAAIVVIPKVNNWIAHWRHKRDLRHVLHDEG